MIEFRHAIHAEVAVGEISLVGNRGNQIHAFGDPDRFGEGGRRIGPELFEVQIEFDLGRNRAEG